MTRVTNHITLAKYGKWAAKVHTYTYAQCFMFMSVHPGSHFLYQATLIMFLKAKSIIFTVCLLYLYSSVLRMLARFVTRMTTSSKPFIDRLPLFITN